MFKVILLFVFLGTFIGSISSFFFGSILSIISVAEKDEYVSVIEGLTASLFLSPILGALVYPIAILFSVIPAFTSAVLYWVILKYFVFQNPTSVTRFLIGGSIGAVVSLIYFCPSAFFQSEIDYSCLMHLIPSGTLASAICALCIKDKFYFRLFK